MRPLKLSCLLAFCVALAATARAELKLIERWPSGTNVPIDAPLRLTFDYPPVAGAAGTIEVCRASDGQAVETINLAAASHVDRFGATGGFYLQYDPVWIEGRTASIR